MSIWLWEPENLEKVVHQQKKKNNKNVWILCFSVNKEVSSEEPENKLAD